jgi:hypothetical protein
MLITVLIIIEIYVYICIYICIFTVTLAAQMTVHSVICCNKVLKLISYVFTGMYTSNVHTAQSARNENGSFSDVT